MTFPAVCEWCGQELVPPQRVACGGSHRLKRWRWLHGIPVSPSLAGERPPEGSVLLDGAGRTNGPGSPSRVSTGGLQVSALRMYEELQRDPPYLTAKCAEMVVARALSERQRDRFLRRVAA